MVIEVESVLITDIVLIIESVLIINRVLIVESVLIIKLIITVACTITMNSIYKKYFQNVGRLNGKVFDLPSSQLFRLERSTDRLLPSIHPASRPIFARSSSGCGNEAHVLMMVEGGGAARDSLLARGLGMNKKFGRRAREDAERSLRSHLNQLNQLLTQFKAA